MVPSGEPVIRVRGKSSQAATPPSVPTHITEVDRSVVMRSPSAGADLDPLLRIVPNKEALSSSLSLPFR